MKLKKGDTLQANVDNKKLTSHLQALVVTLVIQKLPYQRVKIRRNSIISFMVADPALPLVLSAAELPYFPCLESHPLIDPIGVAPCFNQFIRWNRPGQ